MAANPKLTRGEGPKRTTSVFDRQQSIRILLIEDNAGDVALVERHLSDKARGPHHLVVANCLSGALSALDGDRFDVVLLDLALREVSGLKTLDMIRKHTRGAPVVVMTGLADESLSVAALRMGAQDYLDKNTLDSHTIWRSIAYAIERSQSRRQLEQAEARFRLLFEKSPLGIVQCDSSGTILHANESLGRLLKREPGAMVGRAHSQLIASAADYDKIRFHGSADEQSRIGPVEIEYVNAEGETLTMQVQGVAVREAADTVRYWYTIEDRTEQKRAEHKLKQLSLYDPLTGLANRRLFNESLIHALSRAGRSHKKLGVLLIDLDRFKSVNDTLGHAAGDRLLEQVAHRLRRTLRDGDLIARLGGDEFAIILENLDHDADAGLVAEKIVRTLDQPYRLGDDEAFIQASVGIALSPDNADDASSLVRMADIAMYRAKESGGSRYTFYSDKLNDTISRRVALEGGLRTALSLDEFSLVYQPRINLVNNSVVGVEALLRWDNPRLGKIGPSEFIPILERSGQIDVVGQWVLETACRQVCDWRERLGLPELCVSVNISPRQLIHTSVASSICEVLNQTGLPPDRLELEVTENMLADNADYAVQTLQALRNAGVNISVDDFGTGFSSLQYLKTLPITALKIDRSFIDDVSSNDDSAAIVKAIIGLGRSLGLEVIAEGVERLSHLQFLLDNRCLLAQGYLLSRPLDAAATEKFLVDADAIIASLM